MADAQQIEHRGLRLSVWGAAFMAALGIGFYFPTHSQAILLDGLFSLIGFFVSLLTVKVSRLIQQPDGDTFQFGYGAFEPMLNLVKGLLTAGVCIFALIRAGSRWRTPRSEVQLIFAVSSMVTAHALLGPIEPSMIAAS